MGNIDSIQKAIIIGAGPAGLTAARELLRKTKIKPVVLELSEYMGGISRTVNYKGNRIDVGGHRFFSKSEAVMDWWQEIMPVAHSPGTSEKDIAHLYQNKAYKAQTHRAAPNPDETDNVILIRKRRSRVYFLRKFFDYPISLNLNTIVNLGFRRTVKIGVTYIKALLFPIKPEKTLEDFFINRFGKELYLTLFKNYTENVWGVKCTDIKPDWGKQRVKGLSITKAITHAVKSIVKPPKDIEQKRVETSLIEYFMYPKYGPGQMWEEVAKIVRSQGGEIHIFKKVIGLKLEKRNIIEALVENVRTGEREIYKGDYFISSMPVRELIRSLGNIVPTEVVKLANGLPYRDFMIVGLLLNKLKITDKSNARSMVADNWIYIHEKDVRIGRLQIFNNWSPYMVADHDKVWVGLEYYCYEGDELWEMEEGAFVRFAIEELANIEIIEKEDVVDHVVIRMPKAYPGYFGTYDQFDRIRNFTDRIDNLFLVGRNGMHRYNNQDHSMLTAMTAVDNIANGVKTKDNIWSINIEQEYLEEKSQDEEPVAPTGTG